MLDRLTNSAKHRISGLVGLPGIGKTSLTAEALRVVRDQGRFADGRVVLHAEGKTDARELLREVLARFDPQMPEDAPLLRLVEEAKLLLARKNISSSWITSNPNSTCLIWPIPWQQPEPPFC